MTFNTDLKEVSDSVIQRRRSLSAGRSDSAKALAAMLGGSPKAKEKRQGCHWGGYAQASQKFWFDQAGTSGDGKKQLDFRYILKFWQFFFPKAGSFY